MIIRIRHNYDFLKISGFMRDFLVRDRDRRGVV